MTEYEAHQDIGPTRICSFCEGEGRELVHKAIDSAENVYQACPICKGKQRVRLLRCLQADTLRCCLEAAL